MDSRRNGVTGLNAAFVGPDMEYGSACCNTLGACRGPRPRMAEPPWSRRLFPGGAGCLPNRG